MGFNKGYALIIGIARYRNSKVNDLTESVLNDARDVRSLLQSPAHCGYPEKNVRLLLDEQATAEGIREGLRWLADAVGTDGTALVYFSGHGTRIESGPDADNYLIPYDSDPERLKETAISGAELTGLLRKIQPPRLLCIFDSCYAGGVGEVKDAGLQRGRKFKSGLGEEFYDRLAKGKGRVIIASSRDDEVSLLLDDLNNSLFTHYLLEALKGKVPPWDDGLVHVGNVFDYVSLKVRAHANQHPYFKAVYEDNFPIALYAVGEQVADEGGAAPAPPVDLRALRDSLKRFDMSELRLICADVRDALVKNGISLDLDIDGWGGNLTKTDIIIKLTDRLQTWGHLDYLERAVQEEVKNRNPPTLKPPKKPDGNGAANEIREVRTGKRTVKWVLFTPLILLAVPAIYVWSKRRDAPPPIIVTNQTPVVTHPSAAAHSNTPSSIPPEIVRRTIVTRVAGVTVGMGVAEVAAVGDVEGETPDTFPPGAQLFVYVRRRGGDSDAAFERFSPERVGGGSWTVTDVPLRKPLNAGVTKVDVRVAIVPQGQDLDVNSVPPDLMVPGSVEVSVPAPRLSDWKPRSDADGNLTAEGTIQNILEADEKLCFKVEIISGGSPPTPQSDICPLLTEKGRWTYEWSLRGPSVKANAGKVSVRAGLVDKVLNDEIIPERDFKQIGQPQTLRR